MIYFRDAMLLTVEELSQTNRRQLMVWEKQAKSFPDPAFEKRLQEAAQMRWERGDRT